MVRIASPLAVGRYPVTFDEYDYFGTTLWGVPDEGWGRGRRPVINVSWNDAKKYVEWLASKTERPYRLLSEAEWEYACRAGTTTRYWWGDEFTKGSPAHHAPFESGTSEVGKYGANPWGLSDMHGNIQEWVEDCWNDSFDGAPEDGSAWTSGHCGRHVLRGGGYDIVFEALLRSAARGAGDAQKLSSSIGFRVARTLQPSQPSAEQLQKILLNAKYRLFYNPAVPGFSKTKIMKFGPNGKILEGQNNNETTWRIRQGLLELLDSKGNVHSRFYYSADDKRFFHTNDPDTGSILKHGIRDQYMITEE